MRSHNFMPYLSALLTAALLTACGTAFDPEDHAKAEAQQPANEPSDPPNENQILLEELQYMGCLLYTSPSPRDGLLSRMPSSA